jgi:hypothetical protein
MVPFAIIVKEVPSVCVIVIGYGEAGQLEIFWAIVGKLHNK